MSSLKPYSEQLNWIASQQEHMLEMTIEWARINSGSYHLDGLARMLKKLEVAFFRLGGDMERLELSTMRTVTENGEAVDTKLGKALRIRKRPDAPLKVLLTGHMDTVFAKHHSFQKVKFLDDNMVNGPGVADMKGGIIVMLHALHALERSPWAEEIGWEVLINPDEEIGSIGSAPLLKEGALRNDFGLTYEPGLPDGTLAGARKGSGNFTVVVYGRAAHAGRNPEEGRNAVVRLAEFIAAINDLNHKKKGVTVNPARIKGGGATNVVPDFALCHFNSRQDTPEEQAWVGKELERLVKEFNREDGIRLELHGGFTRPPKILSKANHTLFDLIKDCGAKLGMDLQEKPTGGCCDGNNLAAHGLPNVDTLGVLGGAIHSSDEFLIVDSLTQRAQLSALLLLRLASKEVAWPHLKEGA